VRIFYILKSWDLPHREWEYQLLEAFMVYIRPDRSIIFSHQSPY
jgi:hypothetical protein